MELPPAPELPPLPAELAERRPLPEINPNAGQALVDHRLALKGCTDRLDALVGYYNSIDLRGD